MAKLNKATRRGLINNSITTLLFIIVKIFWSVLSDSATLSNLNASTFLTVKDNMMFEPYFWNAHLESDPKHTWHARLSLMVKKLDAIKIYEIAESGNTASGAAQRKEALKHLS